MGRVGHGRRTALKPLQPNVSNTKLLVGHGSPRIPTVGKRQKVANCECVVIVLYHGFITFSTQISPMLFI